MDTDTLPDMDQTNHFEQAYAELDYPMHPMAVSPIFDVAWLDEERVVLAGCRPGEETGAVRIW